MKIHLGKYTPKEITEDIDYSYMLEQHWSDKGLSLTGRIHKIQTEDKSGFKIIPSPAIARNASSASMDILMEFFMIGQRLKLKRKKGK